MNKLQEQLKELKNIQPEQAYSNRSKLNIISTPQDLIAPLTWRHFLLGVFEYGGALALAAILFIVIAGNTPIGKILAPFDAGSLNSAHLRAEAEAIDIQIKLLDVDSYFQTSTPAVSKSTTGIIKSKKAKTIINETTSISIEKEIEEIKELETSTLIYPDDALLLLTK